MHWPVLAVAVTKVPQVSPKRRIYQVSTSMSFNKDDYEFLKKSTRAQVLLEQASLQRKLREKANELSKDLKEAHSLVFQQVGDETSKKNQAEINDLLSAATPMAQQAMYNHRRHLQAYHTQNHVQCQG